MTFVLAGLDVDAQGADDRGRAARQARRPERFETLDVPAHRQRGGRSRAPTSWPSATCASRSRTATRAKVGRRFSSACIELGLERLRRLLRDDAAAGRDRVHGLLADARARGDHRRGRDRPRRRAHRDPADARRHGGRGRGAAARPRSRRRTAPTRRVAARPGGRRALGRQGRQRQLRRVGALGRGLRLAARLPRPSSACARCCPRRASSRSTATSCRTCARSTSSSRASSARA